MYEYINIYDVIYIDLLVIMHTDTFIVAYMLSNYV